MSTTCLITSHNYAEFIGNALDSALAQTVPFDEIIVVDDGSTDGSVEYLVNKYGQHRAVQIVSKSNQGQLSCFNEGFARATGDIVFFLDADDVYEPNYVEHALEVYRRDPAFDFVYCGHRQFGGRNKVQLAFRQDRDLGYSVVLAAYRREWIGAPTSCLSMRRRILEKILPLPFLQDWRTRADDCLVFGASLAGARKYFLAQPLVRYRVHDKNQFFGRPVDKFAAYRRRLAINALFEYLQRKLCYDAGRLGEFHHREFCTIERPTFRQFGQYIGLSGKSRASILRRLACMAVMTAHYLRAMRLAKSNGNESTVSAESELAPSLRVIHPMDATSSISVDRHSVGRRHAA